MRYATQAALALARHEHARVNYEGDPEHLAALWNVRIIPGQDNRATYGPPSVITRKAHEYAPRQRFSMFHEYAHILIQKGGLEGDIRAEVDDDDSEEHLELVANAIAGILAMPDPVLHLSLERYGFSPQAILDVQRACRVSTAAAMRRFVQAQSDAPRTAFMVGATHVLDVASSDPNNRIYRWDRLPDARASYPDAQLLSVGRNRPITIGTLSHEE